LISACSIRYFPSFENHLDAVALTEIAALDRFYPAEEYHQDFYARNPGAGYCVAVTNPKLAKLREKMAGLLIA